MTESLPSQDQSAAPDAAAATRGSEASAPPPIGTVLLALLTLPAGWMTWVQISHDGMIEQSSGQFMQTAPLTIASSTAWSGELTVFTVIVPDWTPLLCALMVATLRLCSWRWPAWTATKMELALALGGLLQMAVLLFIYLFGERTRLGLGSLVTAASLAALTWSCARRWYGEIAARPSLRTRPRVTIAGHRARV